MSTRKRDTRTVRAALSAGPFRRYLLGYVAAITYSNPPGSEWLLTKAGHYEDSRPDAPKEARAHVWPTKAAAMEIARRVDTPERPAYVRPYAYETPNPANAAGLLPIDQAEPMEYANAVTPSHP